MFSTAITPGRMVQTGDRNGLFFSGFSYLGMHDHPAFKAQLTEGIMQYGTVFPSSRAGNIRLAIYEEAEHALAVWMHQQAAAVVSSGYLAAQATVHYAHTKGELLYAPQAHPSLWYNTPQLPELSYEQWVLNTLEKINTAADHTYVVVTDAVNPLTSTIHDFSWLLEVTRKVLVVIDDSHGIGVLGAHGQGISYTLPQTATVRYLITASLAKAFSMPGGVIAGHAADVAAVKKHPFFTASTPMMPAGAYAFLQCKHLFVTQRETLCKNIAHLMQLSKSMPMLYNPQKLPMFVLRSTETSKDMAAYLAARDVIISSFAYPYPHSPLVNRVVLSALHEPEDIDLLYRFLQESDRS
jgi:8-amino-7-oxononanoate synthase